MPTVTATISNFSLASTWTNSNGRITSGPTTADETKGYTISGIPDGATITAAVFSMNIGSPLTGESILRVNNQNASRGSYEQIVQVTGNGTYYAAFQFKANGDESMSNGSHTSSCPFTNLVITVTYEDGETPVTPSGSVTVDIADFNMASSWVNSGGSITNPTQSTATKQFIVTGIPSGATILSAVFSVTIGSPLSGIAILRINDQAADTGNYTQDVKSIVTGNGAYEFTFVFKANGDESLSDGTHYGSLAFTNATVTIAYETSSEPTPEPDPEVLLASTRLIRLYRPKEKEFKGNGICVLSPSSCVVTETAGGEYELEMVHPFDPYGKYLMLVEDYIIRAPVPPMTIPQITITASSVWKVKSSVTTTPLYSKLPSYIPSKNPIDKVLSSPSSYQWNSTTAYSAGEYVVYSNYIYVANYANTNRQPGTGSEWSATGVMVGSGSSSSPSGGQYDPGTIIDRIAGGAMVTKLADYNSTYMRVRTALGKVGYIKRADCEETSTTPEGTAIPEREIIDQLFRIYSVSCEDDTHTVRVSARHISYDYQKNALYDCQLYETDPATAIALVQGSLMYEDDRLIACNLTGPNISADYSFQNPVQALLDPDEGIAGKLRARVVRDNKDFFILDNSHPRKGPDITYGVNMRGVTWERNMEDVITRIIPRADDGNKGKLYLDELFVDSPNIGDFAVISIEVLDSEYAVNQEIEKADGTKIKLTRTDVLQRMREEAENRFSVDNCDAVLVTLDVQFLLIGDTEQYKQYKGLQRVNIYDQVLVKTGPSGMTIAAQITGYEWDCLLKRYNEITIGRIYGQNRRKVAGFQMATGAITYSKLSPGLINRIKGESA